MKIFTAFILTATLCLFTGCKFVALKMAGVRQPRLETGASLSNFLLSQQIDTAGMVCAKDLAALEEIRQLGIPLPDSRFFNRDGFMVDYRNVPTDCNAVIAAFIDKTDSINFRPPLPGPTLDDFLKKLVWQKTQQPVQVNYGEYDSYMLVFWARFLGKVNKHKIPEWQQAAARANRNGKKIRVLLVNEDYQSFWGIDKSQVPTFHY